MTSVEKYIHSREKLFNKYGINLQSKYVDTTGPVKKVHYLEGGTGRSLIVIHGGGSHATEWFTILKPLAEHFHLFVVDRPGHGLTDNFNHRNVDIVNAAIDFVGSFMDAVGLKKSLFLAQSMGGFFTTCFALKNPERVEKIIFIGAPAGMCYHIPLKMRLLGTKGINWLLTKTVAKPGVNSLRSIHQEILVADINKIPHEYLEHSYYGQLIPGNMSGFLSLLENVLTIKGWRKDIFIGEKINELHMPVHFIWGDKDAFQSAEDGKKLIRKDQSKFEIIENAGHCPWLDQPELCTEKIIKLFND